MRAGASTSFARAWGPRACAKGRTGCRVVRGARHTRRMSATGRLGGSVQQSGDLRVQVVRYRGGRRSFVVLDVGHVVVHARAERFLAPFGEGTQGTYAYHLIDHLR